MAKIWLFNPSCHGLLWNRKIQGRRKWKTTTVTGQCDWQSGISKKKQELRQHDARYTRKGQDCAEVTLGLNCVNECVT